VGKPEYARGCWHVMGMMNERIVSTTTSTMTLEEA
jgi:hypothetical protein